MRRLDQHVARIRERKNVPRREARQKIRAHVGVGAGRQLEGDPGVVERCLQACDGTADVGAGVRVNAGQNVWRAGHDGDAIGDGQARHVQRDLEVRRAIVDARKEVTMQIVHGLNHCL